MSVNELSIPVAAGPRLGKCPQGLRGCKPYGQPLSLVAEGAAGHLSASPPATGTWAGATGYCRLAGNLQRNSHWTA
jgi:hypothetical protein